MSVDLSNFVAFELSEVLLALLAALVIGTLAYRRGAKRAQPAPSARASAAIAASGSIALVWSEDDDGQGWGYPDEEGAASTRRMLLDRLGLTEPQNGAAASAGGVSSDAILIALGRISPEFTTRLSALRQNGESFTLFMSGLEVMGKPYGAKAIVWLTPGVAAGDFNGASSADFPAWRTDSQGALLWANAAFLKAVEAIDLDDARLRDLALDNKAREDARMAAVQQISSSNTRGITIGGKRRNLRIELFPAPEGASGIGIDVTQDVEQRDALLRDTKAHGETLNHLTDAVAVFDAARHLTTYNRAFATLWSLDAAWLDERPTHGEWLDKLRETTRIATSRDYQSWKTNELSFYQEAGLIPDQTWTLPDGRILRIARQRQPSGGLLMLFEDISDKMGLQARFKTLIDVQRATLDKLGEAVAVFTADGRLSLANSSFARIFDMDQSFLDTKPEFDLLLTKARRIYYDPQFWNDLKARISDPSPQARQEKQGEFVCANRTNLTWLTRPLPDGATLAAFADVTAARRFELALRDKAAAFQDADRLKTEFVRNVSYQLRTPLTTIGGYSELLAAGLGGPLTQTQAEYLGAIGSASSQLEKLIENILDLAMIDAGQMSLDLGDVNLRDALSVTADFARTTIGDQSVKVIVECDEAIGIIRGDNARIRQILVNLVSNALRVIGSGDTITLGARRFEDNVCLWVSDTGPGIDMNRQASAFEGFGDGDRRAGVSLALVKRFVELHGGWVSLSSPAGRGVTVSCNLPSQAAPDYAAPELDLVV